MQGRLSFLRLYSRSPVLLYPICPPENRPTAVCEAQAASRDEEVDEDGEVASSRRCCGS